MVAASKYRVAIIDEDVAIRTSLRLIVDRNAEFEAFGLYAGCKAAMAGFSAFQPHIVLMEVATAGLSGIAWVKIIRERWPGIAIIMITKSRNLKDFRASMTAGATGYLLKPPSVEGVRLSLLSAISGMAVMPSLLTKDMFFASPQRVLKLTKILSPRELVVLHLAESGMSVEQVSDVLKISTNTVNMHLRRSYKMLDTSCSGRSPVESECRNGQEHFARPHLSSLDQKGVRQYPVIRSKLNKIHDWEELAMTSNYCARALAGRLGFSIRQLERYFSRRFGKPLTAKLREFRIKRALILLKSAGSVKEVAYELSYRQVSNFSRDFKRETGVCPSDDQYVVIR